MKYLSVCSGIDAASVAWQPLGWDPLGFAEVDAFPSAVLRHHYPSVPNYGDLTRFRDWPDANVDLLVGGTPCQSFSIAGLRAGLADPRGNLALTYLAVADRYRPRWLVWENVPGALSVDDGEALGAFLGGLSELGYGWAYRSLDAQYFGLAQRRRRVFVVGHLGDWRCAAAVLFERESLSGHPAPRREAGQVAPTVPSRRAAGGGLGTDFDCDGGLIARACVDVASTLNAGGNRTGGSRQPGTCADNADSLVIAFSVKDHGADAGDLAPTLRAGGFTNSHANGGCMPAVAFDARQSDVIQYGDMSGPLDTDGHTVAVAFAINSHAGTADGDQTNRSHASGGPVGLGISENVAYSLRGSRTQSVSTSMQVRRLTPRECERLQGFPDDYTLIPYRGKPAADGPRYKALGNSMAVPVMAWIGKRIALVDALTVDRECVA